MNEARNKPNGDQECQVGHRAGLSVASLLLVAVFCFGFAVSCARVQPTTSAVATSSPSAEDSLDSLGDLLRKSDDLEACRSAVQQLNSFLARHPDDKPRPLTSEERQLLTGRYGLDAAELAEVENQSFTPLDAHHLEFCSLLQDAVRVFRAEQTSPRDRLVRAFAWVMRQVRLSERSGELLPPSFVLKRGWGTSLERAMVFLAVVEQLGFDGCMIVLPGQESPSTVRYWVPGVLVEKEISLFDTRLGLPLPGPKGQGVATLRQVQTDPEVLRQLTVDAKYPYDVSAEQAKTAKVHVACMLSSLAPRMRYLQDILTVSEKINLWTDPVGLVQRFEGALNPPGGLGTWNQPGDPNTPIRVLRSFVPQDEGGIDRSGRREQWLKQLIPWQVFPRQIAMLQGEPGQMLQPMFAVQFVNFAVEPGQPRDLALRGRFEEATTKLVGHLEVLRRLINLARSDPKLEEDVRQWCDRIVQAYGTLYQAEQAAKNPKGKIGATQMTVSEAKNRVAELWKSAQKPQVLVQAAAAAPLSAEVTYLLALSKHELSERAQMRSRRAAGASKSGSTAEEKSLRDSWKSTASWWETFLTEFPDSPAAPPARLHRSRALQELNEREAAASLLEDLSGEQTNLEKTARLFLAKQLRSR